jgi:lysozyme family protein
VANKLLDMGVNMGVRQASIYAQRALNAIAGRDGRVTEDGVIGVKTLAGIHEVSPIEYYQLLCQMSAAHYRHVAAVSPEQAGNLAGWIKRAEA